MTEAEFKSLKPGDAVRVTGLPSGFDESHVEDGTCAPAGSVGWFKSNGTVQCLGVSPWYYDRWDMEKVDDA